MTLEELFKPTVMLFRLTNSSAISQTMVNKIIQDLINTGEVESFIDKIIIGTEKEETYNKVVEEMAKRSAENNNLYVKLEKCK